MPKEHQAPAPFTDEPMPDIALTPVVSSQLAAIGYDPATQTLAVSFTRGSGAVYHYPNCSAELHAEFLAAESIGSFFGEHIKARPFKKFAPPKPETAAA
jgi:hypothetical protein